MDTMMKKMAASKEKEIAAAIAAAALANAKVNLPSIPVVFYEEIEMIPKTDATDPWQLKRYLNCARLAGERMKQDKSQQFEESRFILSVMTRLCGPSYDFLLLHKTSKYKELEKNLIKFFFSYCQDRIAKETVIKSEPGVPPVNEMMQFFEKLQLIKNDFINMGDFCRDRTVIDEILIQKTLKEFHEEPYKLERRVSQSHFKFFKDDCIEQVFKWFN